MPVSEGLGLAVSSSNPTPATDNSAKANPSNATPSTPAAPNAPTEPAPTQTERIRIAIRAAIASGHITWDAAQVLLRSNAGLLCALQMPEIQEHLDAAGRAIRSDK